MARSKKLKSSPAVPINSEPRTSVEALYSNAIGIDIHHSLLVCCHQWEADGYITTELKEFGTTASQLKKFALWCKEGNPEIIAMESTGVLWKSPYEALEDVGFTNEELVVLNARNVKALMGKKTDDQDALRLTKFVRLGDFPRSFIPPRAFRLQRFVSRSCIKTKGKITQAKARYQKHLNGSGMRLSAVFSDPCGKSARNIVDGVLRGMPLEEAIKKYRHGRCKSSPEEMYDALAFSLTPETALLLEIDAAALQAAIEEERARFELLVKMQTKYKAQIDILKSIPGIGERSARLLLPEIGPNVAKDFPTAEQFASWCGLAPGNNESAKKSKSGTRTVHGNHYVRVILIECAHALLLDNETSLKDRAWAYVIKSGHNKGIVAAAHLLARIIYALFKSFRTFEERPTTAIRDAVERKAKKVQNLKKKFCNSKEENCKESRGLNISSPEGNPRKEDPPDLTARVN